VSWRQVGLLWLVCAALGAEWALVERRRPEVDVEAETRPRFVLVDAAALRELRLTRDGRTIVARRAGDVWSVVEPADATVPSGLLGAFANALLSAEEIAHVAGPSADTHAFGLDASAVRVELLDGAGRPIIVVMGATNPAGTAVYARRSGSGDVVLIGRQVRYYEELIFQAVDAGHVPAADEDVPVG
jgi:hypothetical protein